MDWLAMLGTAGLSSALTWVTSTLAARRAAADARAHWEQGKMLRASSERLLHAVDAYSRLASLHVESVWRGPGAAMDRSLPYRRDETFTKADNELMSALRALRLDSPAEMLPLLDKIEVRANMLRISFTDVPPTREDFRLMAESWPHDRLPLSCGILPDVERLTSEFVQAARTGLGHAPRDRRRSGRRLRFHGLAMGSALKLARPPGTRPGPPQ